MFDVTRIEMHKELTQIQTIVLDGNHTAAQISQMGYQFLHLSPDFSVKGMKYRCEATFTDITKLQHVVKHLDAPDLLTLLWAYCTMKVAG